MRNHLFIVTYGRTGSTLLLAILNAHPKIRVLGENSGLVLQLYRSLNALDDYERHRDSMHEDTPSHPFFGAAHFPIDQYRGEITSLINGFFPPDDTFETTGFKEVRYDMPDLDNYLDFLKSSYEDTRFIFLTREHSAVVKSGFYRDTDPEYLTKYLTVIESRFQSYAKKNPEASFQIDYKDLLSFDRIRELFTFIGHDASEDAWREAISTKHSYGQKSVIVLTADSSLVIFDSARVLLKASVFETSNQELKNMSKLPLAGVLVPEESAGKLQSLVFKNDTVEYTAKTGIPSLGFAKRFPEYPLASHGRFSFKNCPPNLADGVGDLDLVATFANAGTRIIGRLFISRPPPSTQD